MLHLKARRFEMGLEGQRQRRKAKQSSLYPWVGGEARGAAAQPHCPQRQCFETIYQAAMFPSLGAAYQTVLAQVYQQAVA